MQSCFHLSAVVDKSVKGPLAMQCLLMYVNCEERGHQLELALVHAVHLFMRLVNLLIVCTGDIHRGCC